jgi:hypothetical protein
MDDWTTVSKSATQKPVVVSVPAGAVRRVIGRAGATIRELQATFGCCVVVAPAVGPTAAVTVRGDRAATVPVRVLECVERVKQLVQDARAVVSVPAAVAGRLCAWEVVKALRGPRRCAIVVQEAGPDDAPDCRTAVVTGEDADAVAGVVAAVQRFVAGEVAAAGAGADAAVEEYDAKCVVAARPPPPCCVRRLGTNARENTGAAAFVCCRACSVRVVIVSKCRVRVVRVRA